MPVQALCCGSGGESGGKGCSAELGCATAWSEDGADSDVFNEVGVDAGALDEGLVGAVEEVGRLCVLEAALSALCDGCAERARYDNLSTCRQHKASSRILGIGYSTYIVGVLLQKSLLSL